MRALSILGNATYLQVLMAIRVRVAIFFSLVFPSFLFVLFGNIWGIGEPDYYPFILTGIMGITMASDGLISIGNVVKSFFEHHLIKYFRNLPFNSMLHFLGLFFAKASILLFSFTLLCLFAFALFGHPTTLEEYFRYASGVFLGLTMFAFLGLCIAFFTKTSSDQMAVANIVYFIMMFTTDSFYAISELNPFFKFWVKTQPMTYVLNYLRGDYSQLIYIFLWIALFGGIFYLLFTKSSISRTANG